MQEPSENRQNSGRHALSTASRGAVRVAPPGGRSPGMQSPSGGREALVLAGDWDIPPAYNGNPWAPGGAGVAASFVFDQLFAEAMPMGSAGPKPATLRAKAQLSGAP